MDGEDEERQLLGACFKSRAPEQRRWKAASVGTLNEFSELVSSSEDVSGGMADCHLSDLEDDALLPPTRKVGHKGRRATGTILSSTVDKKRSSIFDPYALEALQETYGPKAAEALTTSFFGLIFQSVVFAVASLESAIYPMLLEWTLWDPEQEMKRLLFNPCLLYTAYYATSTAVGVVISLLMGHDLRLTLRGLPTMFPLAAMLAVVEHIDLFAMILVPSSLKSVIAQVRLPAVVLLGVFVFKRRQNTLQWCFILGVCTSVVGFALSSKGGPSELGVRAVSLALSGSILSAGVYAVTELTLSHVQYPFPIQMAQSRVVATAVCAAATGAVWLCSGRPPLMRGVELKFWVCVCGLVIRDWTQTFILKTLNSVWKALSSGVAVCLTYTAEILFLGTPVNPVHVCFVVLTVVDVFGYSFSKL